MNKERKTLIRILAYIGADQKYADYAELQTYLEQYSKELDNQISELKSKNTALVEATKQLKEDRLLMARLASETPQFTNPLPVGVARILRDKFLYEASAEYEQALAENER